MGIWKQGMFAAALAIAAGATSAQTTLLSETWEAGTVGIINPTGGVVATGSSFAGDNTWTVVIGPNSDPLGPHMRHEITNFSGSKWLGWQTDISESPDNQLYYQAPISSTFPLEEAASINFSFDIVPLNISTGGRRSATFYVGADVDNCYRFQINLRSGASELMTISSIVGGVATEEVYGDPLNFNDIVNNSVYTFSGVITPSATGTTVAMEFSDGVNVIESGLASFTPATMLPLSTSIDYFASRARNRTHQLWDNLLLEYTSTLDTTPPVITLNGSSSLAVNCGSVYNDAGATASDNVDGNITTSISTVNPVNTSVPGVYTVTYNVSDAAGNSADEVTRTVTVQNNCPAIIILPSTPTSASAPEGGAVTFGVNATGSGPLTYNWFFDNGAKTPVALGVNTPSITISPVVFADEGSYYCNVSDGITTLASPTFTLDVTPPLPAAGLTTLVAAVLATALGGMAALRRKK